MAPAAQSQGTPGSPSLQQGTPPPAAPGSHLQVPPFRRDPPFPPALGCAGGCSLLQRRLEMPGLCSPTPQAATVMQKKKKPCPAPRTVSYRTGHGSFQPWGERFPPKTAAAAHGGLSARASPVLACPRTTVEVSSISPEPFPGLCWSPTPTFSLLEMAGPDSHPALLGKWLL